MPSRHTVLPQQGLFLLAAITLFWGLNWPVMKYSITQIPVLTFRTFCVSGAAAGLLLIARLNRLPLQVPSHQWGRLLVISLFNITGWNVFALYGLTLLPSGRAAILAYTMPLWGIMLSTWLLGERFTARRAFGLGLGMCGMLLLMANELQAFGRAPMGAIMMLSAAMSWAVGTVLIKRYPVDMPTTAFTGWQLLLGGIPIVIGAAIFDPWPIQPIPLLPALGLLYNIAFGFIFCYWAWYKVVAMVPVSISSIGSLMTPVVGVFSGMILLHERPQWQEFAALALVIGALATVLLPAAPRRAPLSS